MMRDLRNDLLKIYEAGVARVQGEAAVRIALEAVPCSGPVDVLAVGKAADSMACGAIDSCDSQIKRGLVITKRAHFSSQFDTRFQCLEADHPVPTEASLVAGAAMIEFLQSIPPHHDLLILLSGGASSLVEKLKDDLLLDDLKRVNQSLLSAGLDIARMNAIRGQLSELKGGQAARFVKGQSARALLISDVPGDDPAVIGSGPFFNNELQAAQVAEWPDGLTDIQTKISSGNRSVHSAPVSIPHEIVANPALAAEAATSYAESIGYQVVYNQTLLEDDVETVADRVFNMLDQSDGGCYVWNAEPVVKLPDEPGRGGRNQHLGLLLAQKIAGRADISLLVAGTDGTDGPTEDAGALVDGNTVQRGVDAGFDQDAALAGFDAGSFLEGSGDLVTTGPTGTNVMDLVIAIKSPV